MFKDKLEDFSQKYDIPINELTYERSRRKAFFKAALKDTPKLQTILSEIEDPRYITLKELEYMRDYAKQYLGDNEEVNKKLIEKGREINEEHKFSIKTDPNYQEIIKDNIPAYDYINYRDIMKRPNFTKERTEEYDKHGIDNFYYLNQSHIAELSNDDIDDEKQPAIFTPPKGYNPTALPEDIIWREFTFHAMTKSLEAAADMKEGYDITQYLKHPPITFYQYQQHLSDQLDKINNSDEPQDE